MTEIKGGGMDKKDFQKEMNNLMDQLKVNWEKVHKNAAVFAKKGERGLVKASNIGKLQMEIMGINLQKEKIYYDLGKKVAGLKSKNGDIMAALKPYWEKLAKMDREIKTKNREIVMLSKKEK